MNSFNVKNIKGSKKTTIVGGILMAFSLYMFHEQAVETMEYIMSGGIFTTGLGLLFANDRTDGE